MVRRPRRCRRRCSRWRIRRRSRLLSEMTRKKPLPPDRPDQCSSGYFWTSDVSFFLWSPKFFTSTNEVLFWGSDGKRWGPGLVLYEPFSTPWHSAHERQVANSQSLTATKTSFGQYSSPGVVKAFGTVALHRYAERKMCRRDCDVVPESQPDSHQACQVTSSP
ncbi:uncharacterized protein J3D65DRAFT_121737 [Phyllosticta citribraziliensis]|uniref:Uncharacterized protein n=1 Tax=Phyllosticta citribraziliensis TaxID=989973 RepID=A0ABR1L8V4_9PEZI